MITRASSPDMFLVDFSKAKRTRRGGIGTSIGNMFARAPAAVTVDGHAIGQAICAVMNVCDFADVQGRPWLWNEYKLFLARADHDRLRDVEEALSQDLITLLNEEIVRREARMPEGFVVRLLVDEENALVEGAGVLRVKHSKDVVAAPAVAGEITMRADRIGKPSVKPPESTERDLGPRVRCGEGVVGIPEGRAVVLGRGAPDSGPDHVALPGASGKVSRRHIQVLVHGADIELTRIVGANPVEVDGVALADGESVRAGLPVALSLGGGAWRGTVAR